jgi:hypothetical protein
VSNGVAVSRSSSRRARRLAPGADSQLAQLKRVPVREGAGVDRLEHVVGDTKLRASVAAPPLRGGSKVRDACRRPGLSRDDRDARLRFLEASSRRSQERSSSSACRVPMYVASSSSCLQPFIGAESAHGRRWLHCPDPDVAWSAR